MDDRLRMLLDRIYEEKACRDGTPRPQPAGQVGWQASPTPEEPDEALAWFPHPNPRRLQSRFLDKARQAYHASRAVVAHLPTGVGKTSVALAATLSTPVPHVFYLTSRQTQHDIVIKELDALAKTRGKHVGYVDLIAKQQMCVNEEVSYERLRGRLVPVSHHRFIDRCNDAIENKACRQFRAVHRDNAETPPPMSALAMVDYGRAHGACPYYLAVKRMPESRVVIGDYNMVLTEQRNVHLNRLGVSLEDCALVIDEAHNLADRVRDQYTRKITPADLQAAIRLLPANERPTRRFLQEVHKRLRACLDSLPADKPGERAVERDALLPTGPTNGNGTNHLTAAMAGLRHAATRAKNLKRNASDLPWRVYRFLDQWFRDLPQMRIARKDRDGEPHLQLKLIDPSSITRPLLTRARWVILMSGTLHPTRAYAELLGLKPGEIFEVTAESPFPRENRVVTFEPELTTRFRGRGANTYERYAQKIQDTLGPGNAAIFTPSYAIAQQIVKRFETTRPVLQEVPGMSREERDALLDRLHRVRDRGGILVGVYGGSFAEGVDFPGGLLPQIFLVGLPLAPWNLESRLTIDYYKKTHGPHRGQNLAYHIPAVTRAVQAAGRGIRGPHDRCAIHFLDARFQQPRFARLLPHEYAAHRTQ